MKATQALAGGVKFSLALAGRRFALSVISPLLLSAPPATLQPQFNYETNNGRLTITEYTGPGGAVTISSMTDGIPITRIGDYAFGNFFRVTSVTIPTSVTRIGASALVLCSNLASVSLAQRSAQAGAQEAQSYLSRSDSQWCNHRGETNSATRLVFQSDGHWRGVDGRDQYGYNATSKHKGK